VAPGGAEDEAPEFAGVLTDPISARVVATQCTAFLGQPIVPGQIVDITWSQIIIEDDDSDSETGSSLSDQELSGIIEATNGMAANDDDDECRRSDNIRDDGCDGNRKPQSLVDSGRLATPSQRALTGCQGSIINYCDSDYNNYAGDDDQNGKLPAPREKYKTSCDPLLVSSLQLSNIQSPVTNQLATVLSTTTTDKVIIKPAEPVEDSLRCYQCKRKISLAHSLFKCRCHHSFCNMHRYSDRHACTAEMNAKSLSNKNNININNNNNNNNSKKLPPIIQLAKL
jgi:hypothetical protein